MANTCVLPGTSSWGAVKYVLIGGAVVGVAVTAIHISMRLSQRSPACRDLLWSKISDKVSTRINTETRTRVQRHLTPYVNGVRDGHPHGEAAADRNGATISMHATARMLGLQPYVISPSLREKEEAGRRCFYQLTDYAQDYRNDELTDRHMLVMTDVDYYIDWGYWLSSLRPALAYTFVPDRVGGEVPTGVFSIKDNVMTTMISGGGTYIHQLWDYNRDAFWTPVYQKTWGWWFVDMLGRMLGLWSYMTMVMFTVDQFRVSPDRRIISLVPYRVGPKFLWDDEATRLQRAQFRVAGRTRGYNLMRTLTEKGSMISVGREGEPFSALLSESTFIATSIRYQSSTTKTLSDVQRYVGKEIHVNEAVVLADYLSGTLVTTPALTIHGAGTFARHFMCIGDNKLEDGKKYARRYAPGPLTEEAVYPVESHNNEQVCILKRVEVPQRLSAQLIAKSNPRGKGNPPSRFVQYANEFVTMVVPVAGQGRPDSVSEVIEKQDLPSQRLRSSRRIWDVIERFVVQSFQKREAYNVPNDPRNISTVPTMHTLKLSSYTLAFKTQCLKQHPWYMPGKTPVEIARSIMQLAAENESLVEGDYSRFDGTISKWLRQTVEFACYYRWVHDEELEELSGLLESELDPKAFTKLGMEYKPGCSRLSGSPLTTDGNTLINAFVAYATLREKKLDKEWSFRNCGLFYGDDSIMCSKVIHVDKGLEDLARVAGTLGLQLKATERPLHSPVTFLSRWFVDPWVTPDSMVDVKRALLKIHTTIDTQSELGLCGFNKANAYLTTDASTPLVSQWCKAYLKALMTEYSCEQTEKVVASDLPYWFTVKEYRAEPWPQDSIADRVDLVALSLGLTDEEVREHIRKLEQHTGAVDSLPRLEVSGEEAKVECVVDGELLSVSGESHTLHPANTDTETTNVDNRHGTNRGQNADIHEQRGEDVGEGTRPNREVREPRGSTRSGVQTGNGDSRTRQVRVGGHSRRSAQSDDPSAQQPSQRRRQPTEGSSSSNWRTGERNGSGRGDVLRHGGSRGRDTDGSRRTPDTSGRSERRGGRGEADTSGRQTLPRGQPATTTPGSLRSPRATHSAHRN